MLIKGLRQNFTDYQFGAIGGVSQKNHEVKKEKPEIPGDKVSITFSPIKEETLTFTRNNHIPLKDKINLEESPLQSHRDSSDQVNLSGPENQPSIIDKSGIKANSNGTLSVIQEEPPSVEISTGNEINFARLFGVDTGGNSGVSSTGPKNFTQQEVEDHYMVQLPDGSQQLSPEGLKLYESVKAKFLDRVPQVPYGSPTLYLTGGLPGSGKGFILGKILGDNPQHVLVDPDEIKKDILKDLAQKNPALKGQMESNETWSNVIHETSSLMAKQLMSDALGSGKDIIFDSSMASGNVSKYRNYAATARKNGYKVVGIISDVTAETAISRAKGRANKPTSIQLDDGSTLKMKGRLTEASYINQCDGYLHKNLHSYLSEGMYDYCAIFDNNSSENPAQLKAVYYRDVNEEGSPINKALEKTDSGMMGGIAGQMFKGV